MVFATPRRGIQHIISLLRGPTSPLAFSTCSTYANASSALIEIELEESAQSAASGERCARRIKQSISASESESESESDRGSLRS